MTLGLIGSGIIAAFFLWWIWDTLNIAFGKKQDKPEQ